MRSSLAFAKGPVILLLLLLLSLLLLLLLLLRTTITMITIIATITSMFLCSKFRRGKRNWELCTSVQECPEGAGRHGGRRERSSLGVMIANLGLTGSERERRIQMGEMVVHV